MLNEFAQRIRARGGVPPLPDRSAAERSRRWWTLLVVAIMLTASLPMPTVAEEPGESEGLSLRQTQYLAPVGDLLSGSSWLIAEGIDPRLSQGEGSAETTYGGGSGVIAAAPAGQQVPFRSAAPAFSRNQIITRQVGYAPYNTEPHIAVNPLDPEHIVVGTIDYNFGAAAAYVSFDGGETWDGPNTVRYFREDLAGGGDPVVSFDRDGNVYFAQLSLGIQEFEVGTLRSEAVVSSIAVTKSTDGGLTWGEPTAAAIMPIITSGTAEEDGRTRGEITIPFLDKEWITTGPNPNDPDGPDLVLVTYTEFRTRYQVIYADEVPFLSATLTESVIKSASSVDGGMTWSEPVSISPVVFFGEGGGSPEGEEGASAESAGSETAPTDAAANQAELQAEPVGAASTERVVQGSQPFTLSDGTIGVAYHDTTDDGFQKGFAAIMVAFSSDGGATFSEPQQVTTFQEVRGRPRTAMFRLGGSGFPQVAVGPEDEIYLVHTRIPEDKPIDDGDVFLVSSFDHGTSWSEPLRLNGDDSTRPQFYPAVDVSEDGVVHVMWGDMRDDPDEIRYHVYYTESHDRGETFGFVDEELGIREPDTRVTDFASNSLKAFSGGQFIGDYFGIAANSEDVYLVWPDSRLGEFGGPNQQIGFARRTAIRPAELFLNPPSGPAGRSVTIQGYGFQPESDIVLYIGGVLSATLRTDTEGFFTTAIYVPITGEGAQDIRAYDETGNLAIASFYTEFGFDSLQFAQATTQAQIATIEAQLGGQGTPSLAMPTVPAGTPSLATPSAGTPRTGTPVASPYASTTHATPAGQQAGAAAVSEPTLHSQSGEVLGDPAVIILISAAIGLGVLFGRRRSSFR